ncbi:MAG: hypothetical protein H7Y07_13175 [Pyrinomonadaceae bacterium]|nr:hypothetical protein [Sphingobacteriaceae bacterium]
MLVFPDSKAKYKAHQVFDTPREIGMLAFGVNGPVPTSINYNSLADEGLM